MRHAHPLMMTRQVSGSVGKCARPCMMHSQVKVTSHKPAMTLHDALTGQSHKSQACNDAPASQENCTTHAAYAACGGCLLRLPLARLVQHVATINAFGCVVFQMLCRAAEYGRRLCSPRSPNIVPCMPMEAATGPPWAASSTRPGTRCRRHPGHLSR
jgi:hypothetical protein